MKHYCANCIHLQSGRCTHPERKQSVWAYLPCEICGRVLAEKCLSLLNVQDLRSGNGTGIILPLIADSQHRCPVC